MGRLALLLDFFRSRSRSWRYFTAVFPRSLKDGTKATGGLMRRRLGDGSFEYRRPTEEEGLAHDQEQAW